MEDNLTSADSLSHTTNGSRVDQDIKSLFPAHRLTKINHISRSLKLPGSSRHLGPFTESPQCSLGSHSTLTGISWIRSSISPRPDGKKQKSPPFVPCFILSKFAVPGQTLHVQAGGAVLDLQSRFGFPPFTSRSAQLGEKDICGAVV